MQLAREIRTWLDGAPQDTAKALGNTWAGTRDGVDLRRFVIIRLTVSGTPDARTGYLCDIRKLDQLARSIVGRQVETSTGAARAFFSKMPGVLTSAFEVVAKKAPHGTDLVSIEVLLSPFTKIAIERGVTMMLKLTQSFEFSASHRLAIPTLSDSENRELFGKCSNPHGHGHNYILEVTVAGEPIQPDGALTNVGIIDRIVRENIIDAFDHKNLNSECPEFSDLNPTVENIAAVIFTKLTDKFVGSQLDRVRVWETPKTSAEVTRDQTRG